MEASKKQKMTDDNDSNSSRYSIADQQARFAKAKKENNQRYLDITTVYDNSFLKGKRVAVTGANRGLGLDLSKQLAEAGAKIVALVRKSSNELDALQPDEIISGIDVMKEECTESIKDKIKGGPVDIVRFVAPSFSSKFNVFSSVLDAFCFYVLDLRPKIDLNFLSFESYII